MVSKCAVVVGDHAAIGPLTGPPLNRAAAGAMSRMGICPGERPAFKGHGTLDRRSSEVEGVCDERWGRRGDAKEQPIPVKKLML
jgi:hypothetical protein